MNSLVLLAFLGNFVAIVTKILVYAIIFRIVFSWFRVAKPFAPPSRVEGFLNDVTDPVLNLVKKVPHKIGMFDLSPMMAIFGISYASQLVVIILNKFL